MGLQDPRQQEAEKWAVVTCPDYREKMLAPISKIGSLFVSPSHRIMSLNKNKPKITLKLNRHLIS